MKNAIRLQATVGRVKGVFSGFTTGQRTITAIALVVALVGAVVFVSWAGKPSMTPLFTGLSSTDASAITTKLAEGGTAYELADSGHTVLIPAADVNQTRIDLAGQGLPAGGEDGEGGYGMLEKSQGITTSDKMTDVNIKRAVEGELQKAIESIENVKSAKVLLAIPEDSPFTEEQAKPSASVTVGMKPSATLEAGKVEAITHLVATAVPKMETAQVTVVDTTGRLLNTPGVAGAGTAGADARMVQAQAKSQVIARQVQATLDKVVGPGNATVNVQADLNFDDTKTDTSEYIAPKPADKPIYEDTKTETLDGAGNVPQGGVLGPDSTLVPSGNAKSTQKYESKSSKTNFAQGTRRTVTSVAPGGVRRMSVSVIVNSKSGGAVNMADLERQVVAAAGAIPTRDTVAVSKMAFDTTAADAAAKAAEEQAADERKNELAALGKNVLLGLVLLGALLVGFRKSRQKATTTVDLGELSSADLRPELPAGSDMQPMPLRYELEDELPAIGAPDVDPQTEARVQARGEIGALVEESPDEVARLLRGWMAERS